MNKRSAIAVAGGLTGALVSGVAGYSVRLHQPQSAAADPHGKPVVRTETRTITIHKRARPHAKAVAPPVQTIVVHRAPTVVPAPPATHAAPPTVHHTGGSAHASGEGEGEDHGEREGGGGDD